MPLGPVNVSVVERSADIHMSSRLAHRRIRVLLGYRDVDGALDALDELMDVYDERCPTDDEMYELGVLLTTAKRAINKLYSPPDKPPTAGKQKAA
jgi:hypothetical protein